MTTCPDSATLRLYLSEALTGSRQRELDSHIADCPTCQEVLRGMLPPLPLPGFDAATVCDGPLGDLDPDDEPPAIPGYVLSVEKLGAGGMAVVWLGRDTRLNRDVAVKVMQQRYAGHPQYHRRFVEEAQVASQLQHPGIPPVHELGTLPDGRPYFAMKVVKGRTLAELLQERPGPAEDRPRLLTIFEQVCQAVAYAHSKGVIHRDLKPANVMVGTFGEVQVMDWGLAKVLAEGAPPEPRPAEGGAAGSVVETLRSAHTGSATQAGTVLGTYTYMPPEQARGEVGRLDRRCDVFGLGAILCEVLTGKPPYDGTWEELKAQAQVGHLGPARARLEACGADGELVRLALSCLGARPAGRPADASAVARAVAAYQLGVQERLRRAEREQAAAAARAVEGRKRRRVWLALAAALLLLAGGGSAAGLLWQLRRQKVDAGAAQAMGEARLRLQGAWAAPVFDVRRFHEALEASRQAEELARAGEASEDVRRQAADLVAELGQEAGAAERDHRLLTALLDVRSLRAGPKFYRGEWGLLAELASPSADAQFQAAFRAWGLDVDAVPTAEAVARLGGRPPAVVTEVLAALDEWAGERRRQGLAAEKWGRLVELMAALDAGAGSMRRELRALLARDNLGRERALAALALALRPVPVPFDAGLGEDRTRLRRLAGEVVPAKEPVLGLLTLCRTLGDAGEEWDAERLLRAALRARPQEVMLHCELGRLLEGQRRWPEMVESYAAARALRPELGVALAEALLSSGRGEEGLSLIEHLIGESPNNPWLRYVRGHALYQQGRYPEAAAAYKEALDLRRDFPVAHANLGLALAAQGRHEEAAAEFREANRLEPGSPVSHINLGQALGRQGRHKEAEAEFREAIRLDPDYSYAHCSLGDALGAQGRHKEAEAAFREAIRLDPDYPGALCSLGRALIEQGRFADALQSLRRGHELGSKQAGWPYPSVRWVGLCERLVDLDGKLPAVLEGKAEPATAAERLEFASLCRMTCKRLHLAAARLAADAFAADGKLADDLQGGHRYDAARSAALAAAGQGADATDLPAEVAVMLRRQALGWLRADLALYAQMASRDDPADKQAVRQRLQHWQQDTDLASVRDALDQLPEGERQDWQQLWEDVSQLLRKVASRK
jgi:serine/threonine-protein kinase